MLLLPDHIGRESKRPGVVKTRGGVKTHDTFKLGAIIPVLNSRGKSGILAELAGPLSKVSGVPQDQLLWSFWERERLGSTGIGGGLATPNCRSDGIERCYLVFGRTPKGVDFEAIDGQPVRLFFSFCSPIHKPGLHIKLLASLGHSLKNRIFRNQLMHAENEEKILELISNHLPGSQVSSSCNIQKYSAAGILVPEGILKMKGA
jgi:PTS system nitrogen regulatory IIA component